MKLGSLVQRIDRPDLGYGIIVATDAFFGVPWDTVNVLWENGNVSGCDEDQLKVIS